MGRGINNLCALMTGSFSVLLLDTGNNLLIMTLSLVLFAVISVVLYLYFCQYETTNVQIVSAESENVLQEEEIMQKFCERFVLTQREGEVLEADPPFRRKCAENRGRTEFVPCGIVPSYQQHK